MSDNIAKALPEVGKKDEDLTVGSSPNIKSALQNPDGSEDSAIEARRKRETVVIDGVPIDESDIKFHSSKINQKDLADMFINVEGAEQRAREAKREAKRKAELAERERLEAKRAAERKVNNIERAKQKDSKDKRRAKKRENKRIRRENLIFRLRENHKIICKYIIIGVITLVVLVVAAIFGIKATIKQKKIVEHQEYNNKVIDAFMDSETANSYFIEGDYADGMAAYDELIKNAKNEESKALLYIQRATAIYDCFGGDMEINQALKDAREAEKIHPNSQSASMIAILERHKGNEDEAIKYEKLANERRGEDLDPRRGEG